MITKWFYEPLPVSGFIVKQKDPDGLRSNPICAVYLEEHARMICAAPEMLEALESFLYPDNPDDWQDVLIEQIPRLRAAIAKAKGGTP
jgi:hypothetical protein